MSPGYAPGSFVSTSSSGAALLLVTLLNDLMVSFTPFENLTVEFAKGTINRSIGTLPNRSLSIDRRISTGRWAFLAKKANEIKGFWVCVHPDLFH